MLSNIKGGGNAMKRVVLLTGLALFCLAGISWGQTAVEYFHLGQDYLKARQYSEAIGAFEKSLDLEPSYIPAYSELGFAYRLSGDYEKARQVYLDALELAPDNPGVHLRLGEVYQLLDNHQAAEEEFAEYRRLISQNSD
jgi:Tfp pilus assembly protein PilF